MVLLHSDVGLSWGGCAIRGCCQPSSTSSHPKRLLAHPLVIRRSGLKVHLVFQALPVSGLLTNQLPVIYSLSHLYLLLTGCSGLVFSPLSFLRHLDFFEMLRNEDELEFAKRFELVSTNAADADTGSQCHS